MDLTSESYVLNTLMEVSALDDVQGIVDRVCQCVVKVSPFQLALLSLHFESDIYVGLEGGTEEMRRRFLESARRSTAAGRERRRREMWDACRLPGTNAVFIPEGSGVPTGPAFQPCPEVPGAEWRPEDRLMVFVRDADGTVRGILSLDRPFDGARPSRDNLGAIKSVDRLMQLMGVIIHNKHLARKLRESEQRYAAVVEQGHDGILIARDGRVLFANRRVGEMLACDPLALAGRPFEQVVCAGDAAPIGPEAEGELLGPRGKRVPVAMRIGTILIAGAPATMIAAADVTERRRILAQLTRSQKLESVGTLASGMAHDFNNLLGGIVGYAGLLKGRLRADADAVRFVSAIEQAAARAAGVTQQLLGTVRDEKVRVAPFHAARVLEELARLLGETFGDAIRIARRCAPDLPAVIGDESQIHQVLLNVCLNARDAMPDGGELFLDADRVAGPSGNGVFVRLRVRDTGTGMDEATLGRVFDPFFTTKEVGKGTGLGLFMAYRIVERHGGRIDLTSRVGEGTTVEIVLPAREAVVRTAQAPGALSPSGPS